MTDKLTPERIDAAIDLTKLTIHGFLEGGGALCFDPFHKARLEALQTILAALELAREMTWRPIETAPKDGNEVLVYRPLAEKPRSHDDFFNDQADADSALPELITLVERLERTVMIISDYADPYEILQDPEDFGGTEDGTEALIMSYENIQGEARSALAAVKAFREGEE